MRHQPALNAFTLVEMLVTATLTLLLLGLLGTLLLPGIKAGVRGTTQAELGEQALVILASLSTDLQQTAPVGLSVDKAADHCRLCVHPLVGAMSNGGLEWADRLIGYGYEPALATVVRKDWVSPGPPALSVQADTPFQATGSQMQALMQSTRPGRTLATGVEAFDVSPAAQLVQVKLTLGRPAHGDIPAQKVVVTRSIGLRNKG